MQPDSTTDVWKAYFDPNYGHIPALKGVWATGITLEGCRRSLAASLEDWILFSLTRGVDLPEIGVDTMGLSA